MSIVNPASRLCHPAKALSDFSGPVSQGRHGRRPGEEESDVDIEGFEEEDDGKPKTPAPVRQRFNVVQMR